MDDSLIIYNDLFVGKDENTGIMLYNILSIIGLSFVAILAVGLYYLGCKSLQILERNEFMKKNITQEKMRYLVPNEVNNFWSAHRRFILLCSILVTLIFTFALCLSIIINVQKFEPKISFVFCCEVEDYDSVLASTEKYTDKYAIHFIRYEEQFKNLDSTSDHSYDLSPFGLSEDFDLNNWQYSDTLLYVLNKDLSIKTSKSYGDVNCEDGIAMKTEIILDLIESIVRKK